MTTQLQQQFSFAHLVTQPVNKVCMYLEHQGNLILLVRFHPKDNSVSIEAGGGKIDRKSNGDLETPVEALIREGGEEFGILIKPHHMMTLELHPHTGKPVAYYSCEHVSGTPFNKAKDEHLGILEIPTHKIDTYKDLNLIALDMAEKIVEAAHTGEPLSRPIEFRVPEDIMIYIQQRREEPGAAFTQIPDENSYFERNPS